MSKIWEYVVALSLLFVGLGAVAQDKTSAYYNTHESEILPDAQVAFQDGDYDRTVELCRLHYVIVGDMRADALRDKARECAKLTIEMNAFASAGQRELAQEKAKAILALNPEDKKAQELSVNPTTGAINGHEWVDLGLPSGIKWATTNVGASSPEGYGSYFAWGETSPKSDYSWLTYRFRVSGDSIDNVTFSKYNTESKYGTVDNKTRLDLSDDAARQNWGGSWRMPTDAEWAELCTECTWTWTTLGGINGNRVASKTNGNSIFLPAAGYRAGPDLYDTESGGGFWSSALYSNSPYCAQPWIFNLSEAYLYVDKGWGERSSGYSVRPVSEYGKEGLCDDEVLMIYNPTDETDSFEEDYIRERVQLNDSDSMVSLVEKIVAGKNGEAIESVEVSVYVSKQIGTPGERVEKQKKVADLLLDCLYSCGLKKDQITIRKPSADSVVHGRSRCQVLWTIVRSKNASKFVDLGLPSGTLWKSDEESDSFLFDEAISRFGESLPTKTQFQELIHSCKWSWIDWGYQLTGPNGNTIVIPARAFFGDRAWHDMIRVGRFWSSSLRDSDDGFGDAWGLDIDPDTVELVPDSRTYSRRHVLLVNSSFASGQ